MMPSFSRLRRDRKGVGAVEFALILPVLILIIVGISQMGILYFAHAGLRDLVADSARFASIDPRPTEEAVIARIDEGGFGLKADQLGEPTVTYGATDGNEWAEIELSYTINLDFIFWSTGDFQIEENRRVFIYPEAA